MKKSIPWIIGVVASAIVGHVACTIHWAIRYPDLRDFFQIGHFDRKVQFELIDFEVDGVKYRPRDTVRLPFAEILYERIPISVRGSFRITKNDSEIEISRVMIGIVTARREGSVQEKKGSEWMNTNQRGWAPCEVSDGLYAFDGTFWQTTHEKTWNGMKAYDNGPWLRLITNDRNGVVIASFDVKYVSKEAYAEIIDRNE